MMISVCGFVKGKNPKGKERVPSHKKKADTVELGLRLFCCLALQSEFPRLERRRVHI